MKKLLCKLLGHDSIVRTKWFDDLNKHQETLYCRRCEKFL